MRGLIIFTLYLTILVGVAGLQRSQGQSTLDLRINEILVFNDSNYVDDFGKHSPWIEIFNSAYNKVNIGGMYLTDDLSQPTKYLIPKGQQVTSIPSRSYLVFWADSMTTHGILHLNFKLDPGETLALFDSNGRTLIDSMKVPTFIAHDLSWGRVSDGAAEKGFLDKTTPKSNNNTNPVISSGDEFEKYDPTGAGMIMISMGVVFTALALLFLVYKTTGRLMKRDIRKEWHAKKAMRLKKGIPDFPGEEPTKVEVTGEINAVLALSLYLYSTELHDAENTVLTINKVSRTYSPWSSKIYGLRKLPN